MINKIFSVRKQKYNKSKPVQTISDIKTFQQVLSLREYAAWFWLPHRESFVDRSTLKIWCQDKQIFQSISSKI